MNGLRTPWPCGISQVEAIKDGAREHNQGIVRYRTKVAIGAGKTAVMGMVIAWNAAEVAASGNRRHSGRHFTTFVAMTPGHTVRALPCWTRRTRTMCSTSCRRFWRNSGASWTYCVWHRYVCRHSCGRRTATLISLRDQRVATITEHTEGSHP